MNPVKASEVRSQQLSLWHRANMLAAAAYGWGQQLHRYTLVGGLVFLIDLVTYWMLMNIAGSWYLYAHFISRTVGGAACFLLNRYVTFKKTGTGDLGSDLSRFLVLYGISFCFASALVYANVTVAGLGPMAGKVVAEVLVFLFNYTVMKYWVMKPTAG